MHTYYTILMQFFVRLIFDVLEMLNLFGLLGINEF